MYAIWREEAADFVRHIKSLGFRVFLAEAGYYGFVTDADGSRVVSFSFSDGGKLGGTYGPPSRESGTGWGFSRGPECLKTKENVEAALAAMPPKWCGNGWRYLLTLEQYMALYNSSSRFSEVTSAQEVELRP